MARSTITVIPTKNKSKEKPEYAGDYVLERVVLKDATEFERFCMGLPQFILPIRDWKTP